MPTRFRSMMLAGCLIAGGLALIPFSLSGAETGFAVSVDASQAQPRSVEDATTQAVKRDYAHAWQALVKAMEDNRADLLQADFAGIAREKLTQAIADQKKTGLRRRYIDHGHRAQVVFYSTDGSAMELHDVASVEIELLDGDKVVHREQTTVRYVALLTPAESSWKVRVLESVPSF